MASLLESVLKQKIAAGFRGKLLTGTIRRDAVATLNSAGDPATVTTTTATFASGIRETFSAPYRVRAGIPDTDVGILILLGSITGSLTPRQDDHIYIDTPILTWFKVRRVLEIDPAGASIRLQVYEVPAPA